MVIRVTGGRFEAFGGLLVYEHVASSQRGYVHCGPTGIGYRTEYSEVGRLDSENIHARDALPVGEVRHRRVLGDACEQAVNLLVSRKLFAQCV